MADIVLFCHSLRSDWNHGNAHFLRGIVGECRRRGFDIVAVEPADGWSARHLEEDHGPAALEAWRKAYPEVSLEICHPARLDLDRLLEGAALVLVHEWSEPGLVARIAAHRRSGGSYLLLFHDTHHRMATAPDTIGKLDLDGFDGVLAFGEVLRDAYAGKGWGGRAFTWHEAADLRVFGPRPGVARRRDLVWIGNWGDDERTAELQEYLIEPATELRLATRVHGVRYPGSASQALAKAGIEFAGYLPNFRVPEAFAAARMTIHIPRRPYARMLPGIPTIRIFEALACGIPLVCAPWDDCEQLFSVGEDFLVARNGGEMRRLLDEIRHDQVLAAALSQHGRATIEARHSCVHRVDELLSICRKLGREISPAHSAAAT